MQFDILNEVACLAEPQDYTLPQLCVVPRQYISVREVGKSLLLEAHRRSLDCCGQAQKDAGHIWPGFVATDVLLAPGGACIRLRLELEYLQVSKGRSNRATVTVRMRPRVGMGGIWLGPKEPTIWLLRGGTENNTQLPALVEECGRSTIDTLTAVSY